jgi:hypothetical protein
MLKKVAGLILPQYREPSICEACGELFTCGATLSGCWCQEIKLSEAVRTELRSRYDRCLCRTCLEGFAKGERNDGEKEEPLSTRTAY